MHELVDAVMQLDADSSVRAIIITGRGKAFAAGADIREMAGLDQAQVRATAAAAALVTAAAAAVLVSATAAAAFVC
jgi:enoyl-CoA hydratase/carnithine racemase